jgi:hypothetical protein
LGVKPLCYSEGWGHFMFASEITPIHACGLFDLRIDLRSSPISSLIGYICAALTLLPYLMAPSSRRSFRPRQS